MTEFFRVLGRTPPIELNNNEFAMLAGTFVEAKRRVDRPVGHRDLMLAVGIDPRRGGVFHGERMHFGEAIIDHLLVTRILVEIPGGGLYRLTDVGLETLRAYLDARSEFQRIPLISVGSDLRSELTFTPGQRFQARSFVQQLLARVDRQLGLLDPYLKATTVYQLGSLSAEVALRLVVTSKANWGKTAKCDTIEALRLLVEERSATIAVRQHPSAHSRWLLVDAREVWESSQTLGDLGRETGTVSQQREPERALQEFDRYWSEATTIEGLPDGL